MTLYPLIRPLLFQLDAERAHGLALAALRHDRRSASPIDSILATTVAGIDFPGPVGLAAGFDKNAEVPDAMLARGFGYVEVGTLTPLPQIGNARPRLFRLVEDQAVINRLGFNNQGQTAARARLAARRGRGGIVGVNIGANKDAADRIADYATGVRTMAPVSDYLTINISSPNTPGLRMLQSRQALDELLAGAIEARGAGRPPIFLKIAPDLTSADIDDIATVALDRGIDGLIVANTTISRPPLLSVYAGESGGLSGAPLRDLAARRLSDFRTATGGALPLIAAGGIASAAEAYARIRAGASLIQLYSALVYAGPGLARQINAGLAELVRRDGLRSIADAVGTA